MEDDRRKDGDQVSVVVLQKFVEAINSLVRHPKPGIAYFNFLNRLNSFSAGCWIKNIISDLTMFHADHRPRNIILPRMDFNANSTRLPPHHSFLRVQKHIISTSLEER